MLKRLITGFLLLAFSHVAVCSEVLPKNVWCDSDTGDSLNMYFSDVPPTCWHIAARITGVLNLAEPITHAPWQASSCGDNAVLSIGNPSEIRIANASNAFTRGWQCSISEHQNMLNLSAEAGTAILIAILLCWAIAFVVRVAARTGTQHLD